MKIKMVLIFSFVLLGITGLSLPAYSEIAEEGNLIISNAIDSSCTTIVRALAVPIDETELNVEDCVYSVSDQLLRDYDQRDFSDSELLQQAIDAAGREFIAQYWQQ